MRIGDTQSDYSNLVVVVWSSGTRKSRMVNEQASLVFTLPINLWASNKNNYISSTFFICYQMTLNVLLLKCYSSYISTP